MITDSRSLFLLRRDASKDKSTIFNIILRLNPISRRGMEFDISKQGLGVILKPWQEETLHVIWADSGGVGSHYVWEKVNDRLGEGSISRASIINFLEWARGLGVLRGIEEKGRGGYRWTYSANMDEAEFRRYLVRSIINCLLREFPNEAKDALKSLGIK